MSSPAWLDEVELDPTASPIAMGIRSLGNRPWLITDDRHSDELALKAELCRTRLDEVFSAEPGTEPPGGLVVGLLGSAGFEVERQPDRHPLDDAGRSVQEDLCLMGRRADGWYLTAASLCFPSRWRLADKIGRHITEVHGPVAGYRDRLAQRVDSFFDRVSERPVWRRNWFVHPNPALFQPDRPAGGDPVVPAAGALDGLYVRSERQTLRRLDPLDDFILFTIRVQQATVRELMANHDRGTSFRQYLADAPTDVLTHRGMAPDQVDELRAALEDL